MKETSKKHEDYTPVLDRVDFAWILSYKVA